jgi:hypothetical protein
MTRQPSIKDRAKDLHPGSAAWSTRVVKGENRHGTLFLDNRAAQKPRKSIG